MRDTRTLQEAVSSPVTAVMKELTTTYQTVVSYDACQLRRYDLTPAQADVIVALGDKIFLSCKQLAEESLVTRGTLSGVLDRLENRGLLERKPSRQDRRKILVRLTRRGQALFEEVFPERISGIAERFEQLDEARQDSIVHALRDLRLAFAGSLRGRA
jgi:MarR family 2-MHQ and catechol resistance regulon transcriptional repressor